MEKQEITIYDVAREADVSMATVSRVVNGNKNVREETRKKVQAVIDRLDYQPNAVARGLASKKTTTIGLIVPELNNLYFSELAKGIDDIATIYKYNIIITSVDNSVNREEEVIQNLLRKQVDGVIYMADELTKSASEAFNRTRTPVVLAGTVNSVDDIPSVNIDYKKAISESVDRLVKNGKKNLGLVVGRLEADINKFYRIAAFKDTVKKHNLKFSDEQILGENFSYEDGVKVSERLQQLNLDGVIVSRDLVAAGIVNTASANGVKIPDDLEVITSNNTIISKITRPSVSSIKQPLYDIGAVSMRILTKMINREALEEPTVVLPFEFNKRESTK